MSNIHFAKRKQCLPPNVWFLLSINSSNLLPSQSQATLCGYLKMWLNKNCTDITSVPQTSIECRSLCIWYVDSAWLKLGFSLNWKLIAIYCSVEMGFTLSPLSCSKSISSFLYSRVGARNNLRTIQWFELWKYIKYIMDACDSLKNYHNSQYIT